MNKVKRKLQKSFSKTEKAFVKWKNLFKKQESFEDVNSKEKCIKLNFPISPQSFLDKTDLSSSYPCSPWLFPLHWVVWRWSQEKPSRAMMMKLWLNICRHSHKLFQNQPKNASNYCWRNLKWTRRVGEGKKIRWWRFDEKISRNHFSISWIFHFAGNIFFVSAFYEFEQKQIKMFPWRANLGELLSV